MCRTELLSIALDRSKLFGIESNDIHLTLFAVGGIAYASRVELKVPVVGIIFIAYKHLHASIFIHQFEVVGLGSQGHFAFHLKAHIEYLIGMRQGEICLRHSRILLHPIQCIYLTSNWHRRHQLVDLRHQQTLPCCLIYRFRPLHAFCLSLGVYQFRSLWLNVNLSTLAPTFLHESN